MSQETAPKSVQAARHEQSEALKKILNISSTTAAALPPAPQPAWIAENSSTTSHPVAKRSANVIALEDYVRNQMKIAAKPSFEVKPGKCTGTHVASVTVHCGDADGPLTLSSEPKNTPEFAIDVVSSMALQTLTIKHMIKQMGGASSPVGETERGKTTSATARLLPSPGSAFTAVGSPPQHSTISQPPPPLHQMRQQQHARQPRPLMSMPPDPSNSFPNLIPPRMIPPSMQHLFQQRLPAANVIPHLSLNVAPNGASLHQSPPHLMNLGIRNTPGSYPGSYPGNAADNQDQKSNAGEGQTIYHHVAKIPEDASLERRPSKSSIPPAFVPLQVLFIQPCFFLWVVGTNVYSIRYTLLCI